MEPGRAPPKRNPSDKRPLVKLEKQLLRDLSYFESDPQTDERDEATMDGLVMPKILEILRREPGWDRQAIMSEYLDASTREPGWGKNLNRWIDQLLRLNTFKQTVEICLQPILKEGGDGSSPAAAAIAPDIRLALERIESAVRRARPLGRGGAVAQ